MTPDIIEMNNVCIVSLTGVPAAGKTTFCQRFCDFLTERAGPVNAIHVEFDQFITIPSGDDLEKYTESKTFKWDRFRLRWIIREFVQEIKAEGTIRKTLLLVNIEYPKCMTKCVQNAGVNAYVLLVDDNMYYKSMRKEIQNIARDTYSGFLTIYFDATLEGAINRNKNRTSSAQLSNVLISNMYSKYERPEDCSDSVIRFNLDKTLMPNIEEVIKKVQSSIQNPLKINENLPLPNVVQQSVFHQLDLILRQEISRRMQLCRATENKAVVSVGLCQKRKQLLFELRSGLIEPPGDLNEIKAYL